MFERTCISSNCPVLGSCWDWTILWRAQEMEILIVSKPKDLGPTTIQLQCYTTKEYTFLIHGTTCVRVLMHRDGYDFHICHSQWDYVWKTWADGTRQRSTPTVRYLANVFQNCHHIGLQVLNPLLHTHRETLSMSCVHSAVIYPGVPQIQSHCQTEIYWQAALPCWNTILRVIFTSNTNTCI